MHHHKPAYGSCVATSPHT